jgi:hypothetical protein
MTVGGWGSEGLGPGGYGAVVRHDENPRFWKAGSPGRKFTNTHLYV